MEPPDWSSIQGDIHCPFCRYNLHGIGEPRCPECGYTFGWPDLLDPTRRLHPYLFEHHPERNLWSFWRTATGALLPRRFWRAVQPESVRPRRLILYWVLTVIACYACLQLAIVVDTVLHAHAHMMYVPFYRGAVLVGKLQVTSPDPRFGPVGSPITDPKLLQQYLDQYFSTRLNWERVKWMGRVYAEGWLASHAGLVPLLWPWLMFASLMVFQWLQGGSRRLSQEPLHLGATGSHAPSEAERFPASAAVLETVPKLRPVHALRCAIYSGGTLAWIYLAGCVLLFLPCSAYDLFWPRSASFDVALAGIAYAVVGALLMSMVYQFAVACWLYLRCTIYSGGAIVWLYLVSLLLFLPGRALFFLWPVPGLSMAVANIAHGIVAVLLLMMVYQLIATCLRSDRAARAVLASRVVCVLGVFAIRCDLLSWQGLCRVWEWVLLWKIWG